VRAVPSTVVVAARGGTGTLVADLASARGHEVRNAFMEAEAGRPSGFRRGDCAPTHTEHAPGNGLATSLEQLAEQPDKALPIRHRQRRE
jgi:hypothetical protein